MPFALDELDRRLIAAKQASPDAVSRELGEAIGLGTPATHRRLQRLFDRGVLVAKIEVHLDRA